MQMVIQTLIIIVIYFCLFSTTRVEVCSLLLAHGADPTLLNCHSKAAVDAAPTKELQDKLSCMFSFLFDLFLLSQPNIRCNIWYRGHSKLRCDKQINNSFWNEVKMFNVSIEVSWKMKCMRRRKENNYASCIMSFSWSVLVLTIALNLNQWVRKLNYSIYYCKKYLLDAFIIKQISTCSMETEGLISKFKVYPGCLPLTQTTWWVEILYMYKNKQIWHGGRMTATKYMCISKSAEQTTLHHLKSQPMFSEVLQMEWHKPFDFPTVISGFPM